MGALPLSLGTDVCAGWNAFSQRTAAPLLSSGLHTESPRNDRARTDRASGSTIAPGTFRTRDAYGILQSERLAARAAFGAGRAEGLSHPLRAPCEVMPWLHSLQVDLTHRSGGSLGDPRCVGGCFSFKLPPSSACRTVSDEQRINARRQRERSYTWRATCRASLPSGPAVGGRVGRDARLQAHTGSKHATVHTGAFAPAAHEHRSLVRNTHRPYYPQR
jgi:hypothetical protein